MWWVSRNACVAAFPRRLPCGDTMSPAYRWVLSLTRRDERPGQGLVSPRILSKCLCKADLLASVAGMGRVVGSAGGFARSGQSHNSEVAKVDLPECWELVGDHAEVDASCTGEEYAIRGVRRVRDLARLQSPSASVPANLITTAPRIRIPLLFAAFIFTDTIKSLVLRPIC